MKVLRMTLLAATGVAILMLPVTSDARGAAGGGFRGGPAIGGAHFGGAPFGGAHFGGAPFGGAHFGGTHVVGPGFAGARFGGTRFVGHPAAIGEFRGWGNRGFRGHRNAFVAGGGYYGGYYGWPGFYGDYYPSDYWDNYYETPTTSVVYGEPVVQRRVVFVTGGNLAVNVQRTLKREGFYLGSIDGIIGPESRAAIRAYQATHGLPITGRIDASLVRSLR